MGFADKLQGKTLGKYRIDGLIGDGGQAVVYKAWHADFESWVALKFLQEHVAQKSVLRERFKREARLQFKLQHPNIVRVIEIIEEGELMGMAMDWVEGRDLEHYLAHKGTPLDANELARLFLPVLGAVGYAHKQQVIHRDLKPSNILLGGSVGHESPKVMDFGIAKSLEDESQHTKTNSVLGTPHYIAPEQATSSKYVDHRVDIYALGITLYQMIAGHLPFEGRDMLQILGAHLMVQPPPFSDWGVHTSPGLEAVVQRSLAKDPALRFQTCEDFAMALIEQLQMHAAHQGAPTPVPYAALFAAQGALSPAPLSLASAPLSFSSAPLSSPYASDWNASASYPSPLPTGNLTPVGALASSASSPNYGLKTMLPSEGKKRSFATLLLLLLLVLPAVGGGLYMADLLPFLSSTSSSSGKASPPPNPNTNVTPSAKNTANQASPTPMLAVKNAALTSTPSTHQETSASVRSPSDTTPTSPTQPRSSDTTAPLAPPRKAPKARKIRKRPNSRKRPNHRKPIPSPRELSHKQSPPPSERATPQPPKNTPFQRPVLLALPPSPRVTYASCQDCIQKQVQPYIQKRNFARKSCFADIIQLSAKQCADVCQKDPESFCYQYGRYNARLHLHYNPPPVLFGWSWWNQTRQKLQECRRVLHFEYNDLFAPSVYTTRYKGACLRRFEQGVKSAFQAWRQKRAPQMPRSPKDFARGWDSFRKGFEKQKRKIEDALPFKD